MSIKLTDTQLVVLSAAAQRDDRCLVASQNLKGGAAQKVAAKLIAMGLVKEIRARTGTPVWRRDEQVGQSYALRLTAAGANAIAIDEGAASDETRDDVGQREQVDAAHSPQSASPNPSAPRSGTKLAQVIELLQRDDGATIDDLIAATGWLSHTTRAALTGLRKRGYAVTIDRSHKERGSTYRIGSDPTVEVNAAVVRSADALATSATVPSQRQAKSKARQAA